VNDSAHLRILHVVRGLTNSSGTTHIVVPLSEEQARQGSTVTVLFVDKNGEEAVLPRQDLVSSRCFPQTLPMNNPGISLTFARELDRRISEFDIVHIHAIWNFPTYYAMRAALRADVPYMVAPQGSLEPWALRQNYWGKRIYGSLAEIPLFQRATYLQGVSATEVEQIKTYGLHAPTVVIPNGVRLEPFDREVPPLSVQLGLGPSRRTILYLSRLHPKKGTDILIEAFSRLSDDDRTVLVIMGGDAGSGYAASLKQLASQHGIASRCIFRGEVKGDEKYAALLGADLFVLPSHSEGLPVAVLEAMAASRPVVITPGCNLPEVGEVDAGCIVAPDAAELAKSLQTLVSDPERATQMGRNARKLVEERFAWERIATRTLEVYREARAGGW
jgi:poly(glycerol-phosphate) alpha-glucosyltransferase